MGEKYSQGKSYKVIAFMLACFSNDEQLRMLKRVAVKCKEYDCKVVFFSTISDYYINDDIDNGEKSIFDTISVEYYDAIVLMSESFKWDEDQIRMINRARKADVPVIAVDKYMKDCINITFEYGDAFRKIVKHMIEIHGYRTINFMGGIPGNSYSEVKLQVYKEVLIENGITFDPRRVYYGQFWKGATEAAMQKMLDDGLPLPEAIICANDVMAITVCNFLQERGYRIPEDIAVSGFDGIEMEKYSRPRLTTCTSNLDVFIDTVFEMINKNDLSCEERRIPIYNKMQIGRSCGCQGVESVSVCSEMIQLKTDLQKEISSQGILSQMVANYGNAEHLKDVIYALPNYMGFFQYKEFWFCGNEKLAKSLNIKGVYEEPDRNRDYSKEDIRYNVIHYYNRLEDSVGDITQTIAFGELIPQRDEVFEENDFLLVLNIHINGVTTGYTVVSFDIDKFWFSAYASFIINFMYMLKMQKVQVELMHTYMCDSLTGLYNRAGFNQQVRDLMDKYSDLQMAVIMLDMDGLKRINDTFGHSEGDATLEVLGNIVRSSIKQKTEQEIAARAGGDEYFVALVGEDIGKRAEEIVNTIKNKIQEYNKTSGKSYEIHASIGCFTDFIKDNTLDHFLIHADRLMYKRKALHRKQKGDI